MGSILVYLAIARLVTVSWVSPEASVQSLTFADVSDPTDLLHVNQPSVVRVCEAHGAWGGPTYLWSDNLRSIELDEDAGHAPPPPIELYALPDVDFRSDFMAYHDTRPVCLPALFPAYVSGFYTEPGLIQRLFRFEDTKETRSIDEPVFSVSHLNMRTYGHFLLEVLPKLLIVRDLWRIGLKVRVAFPSDAPPVSEIIELLLTPDQRLPYESRRERLRTPVAIFPSLSGWFQPHGWVVSAVWQLAAQLSLQDRPSGRTLELPKRLFLSRQRVSTFRTLENEAELYSAATDYGLELVHPQELPWDDQVRMFFQASHVLGVESSVLHNAMFSPPGTKVVALGRVNGVQAAMAAPFGHHVGYVMPSSGSLSDWTPGAEPQTFTIDPQELRARLETIT